MNRVNDRLNESSPVLSNHAQYKRKKYKYYVKSTVRVLFECFLAFLLGGIVQYILKD